MKVGFSQVDFTPSEGYMPGEFFPFYTADSYTRLLANAAAFTSDEGESVIIISVDCLNISTSHAQKMRAQIAAATSLPISHVMIAATHTHTGPSDHRPSGLAPAEPDTGKRVEAKIVKAGIAAFEARVDAKLGTGKTVEKRLSFNRDCVMKDGSVVSIPGRAASENIVGYLGKVDYDVHVMRIDAPDGKVKGFIVNYANHPDNHKKRKFSADYPGYLRKFLKEEYGEEVTVLFLNGACGDVNSFDYKNNTDDYNIEMAIPPEGIGRRLADTVIALNKSIDTDEASAEIKVVNAMMELNTRKPADWEMDLAREVKAKVDALEEIPRHLEHSALATLEYSPYKATKTDVEMVAVKIGKWAIVTTPGELYTEIGLRIKEASPVEHTLISELTNGSVGYIPPDSVLGTTAYGGRYYAGTLGYGTADTMVETAKKLLGKLV